jgi:ribose transport system permease protein
VSVEPRAGLVPSGLRIGSFVIRRASAVVLGVAFAVIFGILEPETFLSMTTLRLVLSQQVVIGLLAIGALIPLVAGSFDLSIGGTLSLSLVMVTWMSVHTHLNMALVALMAIGACLVAGWINGFVVVRLHVNSFIATLAMSEVLAAISLLVSANSQFAGRFSSTFESFGQHLVFGIQIDVIYLFVIAAVVWYVLEHTPVGRYLYATGGNEEAARLAGLRTHRLTWGALVVSAGISGLAGVVLATNVGIYSNSYGPPLLFPVFAAVFFGATQIKTRPNVWGTLIAMYALAFGVQGIQLGSSGQSYWVTPMFNGVALLIAVSFASQQGVLRLRRRAKSASGEPTSTGELSLAGAGTTVGPGAGSAPGEADEGDEHPA